MDTEGKELGDELREPRRHLYTTPCETELVGASVISWELRSALWADPELCGGGGVGGRLSKEGRCVY